MLQVGPLRAQRVARASSQQWKMVQARGIGRRNVGLTCSRRIASLTYVVLVVCTGPVLAQAPKPDAPPPKLARIEAGAGLLVSVPVGEFGSSVGAGSGFSLNVGTRLGESVLSLAGEGAYWWYGREARTIALGTVVPDAPDTSVRVSTDNAVFLLHARVRAQPTQGRWRPYVDGLVGFTDLVTKTSVDALEADCRIVTGILLGLIGANCEPAHIGGATNVRDFALSYGGGAGIKIGSPPYWFDVSVRYLTGGEADYLRKGALRREGGLAILDITRSRTDMVMIYIGVAVGR